MGSKKIRHKTYAEVVLGVKGERHHSGGGNMRPVTQMVSKMDGSPKAEDKKGGK